MSDNNDQGHWTLVGHTLAFLGTLLSALVTGLLGVRIARINVDAQTKPPAPSMLHVVDERDVWQAIENELIETRAQVAKLETEIERLEHAAAEGRMWKEIAGALKAELDKSPKLAPEQDPVRQADDQQD